MKITFTDKTSIDNRPDLSDIEKITGGNINEIKEVVNANEDELDATKVKVENINTSLENFNKEVESLKENDTKQDEKIEYLEKEAVRLRQDIQASQLTGEAEGESIDLDDSSGARFKKFGVSGNHSQETREGYNKFKPFDSSNIVNSNGTTVKIQNEKIIINGVCTKQWWCEIYYRLGDGTAVQTDKKENLDSSKTYTFGLQRISGDIIQEYVNATVVIDENDKQIGGVAIATNNKNGTSKTFTGGNGIYRAYLYIPQNAVFNNLEFGVLIYEGSEAKDWEQYGATPSLDFTSEIKTVKDNVNLTVANKNYINIENTSKTINGITFTVNSDGSILANGTATGRASYPIQNNFKKFEAGQYFVSGCPSGGSESTYYLILWNENWASMGSEYGKGKLVSLSNQKVKLHINIMKGTVCNNLLFKPQMEKGTKATDYEAHQEQAITMPVQQEMLEGDYFDWDNEEEVHTWNKLVLTGNENLILDDTYKGIAQFSVLVNALYINDNNIRAISNYFKGVFYSLSWEKNNTVTIIGTGSLRFMTNKYTSVDDFKAGLKTLYNAGTPVMIYYKLKTPTRLAFTDEQKTVAKKIKETLHTYKNITHIYSTDETSPIMNVEYAKDLNTTINNIQALVINNASEEVNG